MRGCIRGGRAAGHRHPPAPGSERAPRRDGAGGPGGRAGAGAEGGRWQRDEKKQKVKTEPERESAAAPAAFLFPQVTAAPAPAPSLASAVPPAACFGPCLGRFAPPRPRSPQRRSAARPSALQASLPALAPVPHRSPSPGPSAPRIVPWAPSLNSVLSPQCPPSASSTFPQYPPPLPRPPQPLPSPLHSAPSLIFL